MTYPTREDMKEGFSTMAGCDFGGSLPKKERRGEDLRYNGPSEKEEHSMWKKCPQLEFELGAFFR